jgi:hypothetical protein
MNRAIPAALDITRTLFLEVQKHLQAQHVAVLARGTDLTLWTHHASGWYTHLRSYGVPIGKGLSWIALNKKSIQVFQNPSQHPQVFSPEPEYEPAQIQVSVPLFDTNELPLGVVHVLRNPIQPFLPTELDWLEQQARGLSGQLEMALQIQQEFSESLSQHPDALMIRDFVLYLGESQPIAEAMAATVMLQKESTAVTLPLETRLAFQQQDCRFDGTGKPALQGSNIALSARIVQVVLAYSQQLEKGLQSSAALAVLRREAGWKLDPLVVHAFEQHLR